MAQYFDRDPPQGLGAPPRDPRSPGEAASSGSADLQAPLDKQVEAEYTLEAPVRCPVCGDKISTVRAIRLLRSRVNFTSTLPRRGRVIVCPQCLAVIPAELTNF